MLFLVAGDNTAHNHINFGNYLWAASGYSLGFDFSTLQLAAQANSLVNSRANGYDSQLDSKDDLIRNKLGDVTNLVKSKSFLKIAAARLLCVFSLKHIIYYSYVNLESHKTLRQLQVHSRRSLSQKNHRFLIPIKPTLFGRAFFIQKIYCYPA